MFFPLYPELDFATQVPWIIEITPDERYYFIKIVIVR
jgi:hypothetical protein